MEASYPAQLVGWVVWGKVKSLPWWPGQVMHPSKGPPEVRKMAAMKSNAGKLLVMFLGDNKYAFLTRESVVDFAEHKERHSSTNYASKYWKLGLEEAEELLARRAGLQPATDHEPVDFATKKTNFSQLAKAWAGGSSTKQPTSSGRASDKARSTPSQSGPSKGPPLGSSAKEAKSTLPSVAVSTREPTKSHRASGATADDGRPKSIGGVMLEWARYMPLVTATRKGAESSSNNQTLAFLRRLARGEELDGGLAGEHTLQLLNAVTLQRRLRAVEGVMHAAPPGTLAGAASRQATGATPAPVGLPAHAPRTLSSAGHGEQGGAGGAAGGQAAGAGEAAAVAGTPIVVVQEMLTVGDVAAVPVPAAVLEALRRSTPAPALGWDSSQLHQTRADIDAASAPEAPRPSAAPVVASLPEPGAREDGGGAVRRPVSGLEPGKDGAAGSAAGGAGGYGAGSGAGLKDMTGQQQQREREVEVEMDVVLKVNGKLLPHMSPSVLVLRLAPGDSSSGSPPSPTQQQPFEGPGSEAKQPVQQARPADVPAEAVALTTGAEQRRQDPSGVAATDAVAAAPAAAAWTMEAAAVNLGRSPESLQEQQQQQQSPSSAAEAPAAGPEAAPGAASASAPGAAAAMDAHPLAQPVPPVQGEPSSESPLTASADNAPAGAFTPAAAPHPAPSPAPGRDTAAQPSSAAPVSGRPATPAAQAAVATTADGASAPPLTTTTTDTTTAAVAPTPLTTATTAAAAAAGAATLDLSRGLAPWVRGEVRITSWALCGPRLLLVTVSTDRKRDGGLGGIKREARLLLAEARERRGVSPGAPGQDGEDGDRGEGSGEPKLKRRLRSAASPPGPVPPSPSPRQSSGGGAGKASPPPPPPVAVAAAAARPQAAGASAGAAADISGAGEMDMLPPICTSGPAAAALMRSRMLQQKRRASVAEAAAAVTGAVAGGGGGSGASGAARGGAADAAGAGPGQQPASDLSRSASSAGAAAGGAVDPRAAKRIKLVRFPPGPSAGAAATGGLASRTSSGGGTAVGAAATGPGGAVLGAAGAGAGAAAADAGPPRRRSSYGLQLASDDGAEDRGRGVYSQPPMSYSSGYEAEWDMSYPPWLPQPAQKGAFITHVHAIKNNHHHHHHRHHHHRSSTSKVDDSWVAREHQQQGVPYSGSGASARGAPGAAAHHSQGHNQFRQPIYNHSYNQHQHHHHQHQHNSNHHSAPAASYPHPPQPAPSGFGSPRYGGGGGGARGGARRSSGYDNWQQPDDDQVSYSERRMDWSSDTGAPSDFDYAQAVAAGWLPPTPAGYVYGIVPGQPDGATAGFGNGHSSEQILLDIRVGDEGDNDVAVDHRPPSVSGAAADAAIAITVHLPSPGAVAGAPATSAATSAGVLTTQAHLNPNQQYHSNNGNNSKYGSRPPPLAVSYLDPFAVTPFSPASAVASGAVTPFSPAAAVAAAVATTASTIISPYGNMTPADVDLAVTAAMLADRHMFVCESAAVGDVSALAPPTAAVTAGGAETAAASAAAEGHAAGAVAAVGSGGEAAAVGAQPPRVTLYESEVLRLRQECEALREQVKLRLAPGSLDPMPEHQLSYAQLVAQVSERILALALQLPSLSGPAKQAFIQYSRTLMQEAAACGQAQAPIPVPPAAAEAAAGAAEAAAAASGRRSLAVARVAADLVRSAAAPGLPLHPEDRWAFINLAAELLRP